MTSCKNYMQEKCCCSFLTRCQILSMICKVEGSNEYEKEKAMTKILVMGGSYFIGKKIAETLAKSEDYDVTVLNRGSKSPTDTRIHQIICDRNDEQAMGEALSKQHFDMVVDVCALDKRHVQILCNCLELSVLKKYVFISSSAVYGVEHLTIPYAEEDVLGENRYWTYYGKNKTSAEKHLMERFTKTGIELVILRPPYVYGEYNYVQRESFVFEHILNNQPIIIPASKPKMQFIYTSDLADIVQLLLKRENGNIAAYNVGNSETINALEWVRYCEKAVGKKTKKIIYEHRNSKRKSKDFFPFHDYDNVLDVSKIKKIYAQETDFIEGLKNSYEWFLENRKEIIWKKDIIENEREIILNL